MLYLPWPPSEINHSVFLLWLSGTPNNVLSVTTYSLGQREQNRTLSLSALLGFCILCVVRYVTSPYRKLPPGGPRGYPIIGNVLELRSQQWLKFTEWRKQYGQGHSNLTLRLLS